MIDGEVEVILRVADADVLAGRLWCHRRRATESQTFAYASEYLGLPGAYELDPLLPLVEGSQQTPANRAIFGAFADAAPDRWGRRLIGRAERKRVNREGGTARSFGEADYLLGVRDDLRQGAVRFREPGAGVFLAPPDTGVPSLLDLPRLLGAAESLERDEETEEELATLLRGGSSLGGARPKAHVLDDGGRIAIAKFPSPANDDWDVMRWEAVALTLAGAAGIRVPQHRLHLIDDRPVLVVDRFDRIGSVRIGYVSGLTMLERADGEAGSYLEIADVIARHSPSATGDLRELWRRIAFSVLISNFDDHLRNHGFLRTSTAGWSLSPAFDLNPDPRPGERHLSTAIDFDDTEARVDLLLEVAPEFRLTPPEALRALGAVHAAVGRWRELAGDLGISDDEIARMAPAFEHQANAEATDRLATA
ncbi:MAG: HipA domain-containing protein [Thermoleophilaceae bacterium]